MRKNIFQRIKAAAKFLASGYGDGVGGWVKRTWRGFPYTSWQPKDDQDLPLPTVRHRCRSIWYQYGLARAIIKTYADWVVGSGLELKSEAPEKYRADLERDWNKWCVSKESDTRHDIDFWGMQRQIYESMLLNGDVFVRIKRAVGADDRVRLLLEPVEGDAVESPADYEGKKRIVCGVELNAWNEAVAYYFRREDGEYKRVSAYSEAGRQVVHLRRRERIGSVRGVPILAPAAEGIVQVGRYLESELQTALLQSIFSVIVKTDGPGEELTEQPGDMANADYYNLHVGSGNVNYIPADAEISTISGDRDNSGGLTAYIEAALKTAICPAVGIPFEILKHEFNSSYSASRASIMLFARTAQLERDLFVSDFVAEIYKAWVENWMDEKEITDASLEELTAASWLGPTAPSLDPNKDTDFYAMAVSNGWMTNAMVAQELTRTDFAANIETLKKENAMKAEAGMAEGGGNDKAENDGA